MKARYTHVIFDLDGTIYDSNRVNMEALAQVLTENFGKKVELAELLPLAGVSAKTTFENLGIEPKDHEAVRRAWYQRIASNGHGEIKKFDGIKAVLANLKRAGIKLGIVTSRDRLGSKIFGEAGDPYPQELREFFELSVCAEDVENGKPAPDLALRCLKLMGASAKGTLYVGDTAQDCECARAAGIDFALAMWGYCGLELLNPQWFLTCPYEILNVVFSPQKEEEQWLHWAREIQAIGQTGLTYSNNIFDEERYTRLREIACEMIALKTEVSKEQIREALAMDKGYACPKADTRAAVFNEQGEILMVREKMSGLWNIPGGWCDDGETVVSNVLKELREEACMSAAPVKLIAVLERNHHNTPRLPFGVLKFFVECRPLSQNFKMTDETLECRYFARDALPLEELRLDTNTKEQLELCFEAHQASQWQTVIE